MSPRLIWLVSAPIAAILGSGLILPFAGDGPFLLIVAVPFLVVGVVVAYRRPHNPVGWLFLGFAGVAAVGFTASAYFGSGPSGPGSRPGADLIASLGVHLWHPGFSFFILGFLLFPEGHLLSPRWAIAARITVALGVVGAVSGMLEHDFYADFYAGPVLPDPLLTGPVADIAGEIFGFCVVSLVGMLVVSAVCIFLRFRRSTGVLRQQMKWVVSAVVVFAIALPGSLLLLGAAYGAYLLPLIPISAGIGILRYRLFDIDVIINRALVYGALSAALALVYVLGVVGVGSVVRTVTDQESNNLEVAASTLAVAALFGPLRQRMQSFIDRRFYRHKYDAEETVADFSARLRDQVDLDSLNKELVGVVTRTMQPSHVSVWLKIPTS